MTTEVVQSLNKMYMKYVFQNKFRIILNDQKTLSFLNLKSNHSLFFKIGALKNFAIFTGKSLYCTYFLIKLQAWKTAVLLKRDSNTANFLVNIAKFLRTPILKNILIS